MKTLLLRRTDDDPAGRQRMSITGSGDAPDSCLAGARTVAKFLAENGAVAAGGLARGIGTMVHSVAMGHGMTVAVIGTPLDRTYPKDAVIQTGWQSACA